MGSSDVSEAVSTPRLLIPAAIAFLAGAAGYFMHAYWFPRGIDFVVIYPCAVALACFGLAATWIYAGTGPVRYAFAVVYALICGGLVLVGGMAAFLVALMVATADCSNAARASGCPLG